MASEEVNTRWQERMAPFFEPANAADSAPDSEPEPGSGVNQTAADQMMLVLDEVFHLD